MASATRVDFFFGGVDALAVSFFILEAAAAMASMGPGHKAAELREMAPGLPNLIVPRPRRRRRAPLVFVIKDPPEGLLVAAHVPTSRVWEPVREELQHGASAELAQFELLAVGRVCEAS